MGHGPALLGAEANASWRRSANRHRRVDPLDGQLRQLLLVNRRQAWRNRRGWRSDLGNGPRNRQRPPLLALDPDVEIGQIVAYEASLALSDLDKGDAEAAQLPILAQHIKRDAQTGCGYVLIDGSGDFSRDVFHRAQSL